MAERGEDMKLKSGFKEKIALGLICILIFSYTFYHLFSLFGEDIETYAAGVTTENTVLNYNGYIFRDETVLSSNFGGVVDYKVADGTKVNKGQPLAVVYNNGNANQKEYLMRLDEQISVLEKCTGDALNNVDISAQKQDNSDTYDAIIKMLSAGETGGLSYQAEKLLVGMNTLDGIATDGDSVAAQTLQGLYETKNEMFSGGGANMTYYAQGSGYFYSRSDGCEDRFTVSAADELTSESFYELVEYAQERESARRSFGKISDSTEWKIVIPVKLSEKKYFEVGKTYTGLFTENNQTEIPMILERTVDASEKKETLLVFYCDRLPNNFSFDRCQSVSMTVNTASGIYVPKSVVVREDGVRGVYVLRGSVVHFRYIDIVYEGIDYYLVRENMENDGDKKYLQVNDMVILNGQNMFDGMVLD